MIDAKRVGELVMDSLFHDDEDTSVAVEAEGVMNTFGFHPTRVESHRAEVVSMLAQLPEVFFDDGEGKGMSLMGMVEDRDGTLWGEQYMADQLYCLANALGLAKYVLPRAMWGMLPGSMPYIVVFRSKF